MINSDDVLHSIVVVVVSVVVEVVVVVVVVVVEVVVCYRVGVDACIGDNRSCCSINSLMNN